MGLSSFVKKLYLFGVIFGGRGKKIAGISDSTNNISSTEVIWDSATKTITFTNETGFPSWVKPGGFIRTYDGVPKTTPSSTDINYIPNVILTPNPLTNDGVLFQVLSVSGNVITVDDSGSGATPADRDTTGLPTIVTLEGRIAIVVNDANICRINGSGSTVYNIENQTPSAVPGDGSGIAAAFADHFHAALGSSSSLYLGWYIDDAALIAAHPVGIDGNYANVRSTDTMWIWDSDTNAWVDSGIVPPDERITVSIPNVAGDYGHTFTPSVVHDFILEKIIVQNTSAVAFDIHVGTVMGSDNIATTFTIPASDYLLINTDTLSTGDWTAIFFTAEAYNVWGGVCNFEVIFKRVR